MMGAARTTRQLGGALAIVLALIAPAAADEPVKPALKPSAPGTTGTAATLALAEIPDQRLFARVVFAPQEIELNETELRKLAELAARLAKKPEQRIGIYAYASSDGIQMSARRISLGRALSVRSFLIEHGVESQRMIVRALGKPQQAEVADRVDITWPSR